MVLVFMKQQKKTNLYTCTAHTLFVRVDHYHRYHYHHLQHHHYSKEEEERGGEKAYLGKSYFNTKQRSIKHLFSSLALSINFANPFSFDQHSGSSALSSYSVDSSKSTNDKRFIQKYISTSTFKMKNFLFFQQIDDDLTEH